MYKSRENLSPSCSSSEDLVAYLYGEMNASGQAGFEDHLSGCEICTAEFAELSLARLGVYEWHRDEFVEMATPRFVIPYGEAAKASWFDAVRALFASPARWAAVGGSLAVLTIAAGVMLLGPTEVYVVEIDPAPSPVAVSNKREEAKQPKEVQPASDSRRPQPAADEKPRIEEPQVLKASSGRNARAADPKPLKAKETPQPNQPRRTNPAPRLNDFEDDDDNTLRLGDLLAEVDTRD